MHIETRPCPLRSRLFVFASFRPMHTSAFCELTEANAPYPLREDPMHPAPFQINKLALSTCLREQKTL